MISTLIERLMFASRPMNSQDWLVVGVTRSLAAAISPYHLD